MTRNKKLLIFLSLNIFFIAGCSNDLGYRKDHSQPLGLVHKKEIKVVYQIKTDESKNGVGAGLYYLKKLSDAYDNLGIEKSDRQIHGVFHGDAGYMLLKDEAFSLEKGTDENPNKRIIQELLKNGVKLELCASTMKNNGWQKKDVLEGVTIVAGAYPRIIDLQMSGFAYIRF